MAMSDKEKQDARFGFTEPDKCVAKSQCVGCSMNKGRQCGAYGQKPMQYARAIGGVTCPRRTAVN